MERVSSKQELSTLPKGDVVSINSSLINLYVLVLVIPIVLLLGGPLVYSVGVSQYLFEVKHILTIKTILLMGLGIIVHEGLHGITWLFFLKGNIKKLKFGFNFSSFSPYTHSAVPIKVWQYKVVGIMPLLVMGIIPVVISYIVQCVWLNFVALMFIWAAGGDMLAFWKLRKLKRNQLIVDHPNELGFIVL